jgi:hypothetical protein
MKEMTQVGRWILVGLLAIAVAIGISTFVAGRDWDNGPGNGHARSEVVTTADGQTIVIEHDRRGFFPFFLFIPFLFFGLFWLFGPWRWRGSGGRGGGPGQAQSAEWERWLDDWHRRQHDQPTAGG